MVLPTLILDFWLPGFRGNNFQGEKTRLFWDIPNVSSGSPGPPLSGPPILTWARMVVCYRGPQPLTHCPPEPGHTALLCPLPAPACGCARAPQQGKGLARAGENRATLLWT